MNLGNKILELRKKAQLSQEQLAEKLNVTRQTISKWELNETSPDIKQAKELSKIFKISLDELTNNDIKDLVVEKISNTEKLAGIIIKLLKVIGILFIVYVVLIVVAIISFTFVDKTTESYTESVEIQCSSDEKDYIIDIGSDGYFNCSNCSKQMQKDIKDNCVDFGDISKTTENIDNYFKKNGGSCK